LFAAVHVENAVGADAAAQREQSARSGDFADRD
jgi:hypothetical protein